MTSHPHYGYPPTTLSTANISAKHRWNRRVAFRDGVEAVTVTRALTVTPAVTQVVMTSCRTNVFVCLPEASCTAGALFTIRVSIGKSMRAIHVEVVNWCQFGVHTDALPLPSRRSGCQCFTFHSTARLLR